MNLRERFKNARSKFRIEEVTDPDILAALGYDDSGERLYVREMSAKDKGEYETSRVETKVFTTAGKRPEATLNLRNLKARLLVKTLCDKLGIRHLSDDDAGLLGDVVDSIIDPLYEHAKRVAGVDQVADEELEKNLNGQPALANGSLPGTSVGPTLTPSSTPTPPAS